MGLSYASQQTASQTLTEKAFPPVQVSRYCEYSHGAWPNQATHLRNTPLLSGLTCRMHSVHRISTPLLHLNLPLLSASAICVRFTLQAPCMKESRHVRQNKKLQPAALLLVHVQLRAASSKLLQPCITIIIRRLVPDCPRTPRTSMKLGCLKPPQNMV